MLKGRGLACKNEPKTLNTLHGTLGYINKAKTEVGLLLKASGPLLFSCPVEILESEFYYSGSVIARISAVNKLVSSLTLEYQQKSSTEEEWEKFEGEKCTEAQEEEAACPHRLYSSVERSNYGPSARTTLTGSLELNGFTYAVAQQQRSKSRGSDGLGDIVPGARLKTSGRPACALASRWRLGGWGELK